MNYFGFYKLSLVKSRVPIWLKYSIVKPSKFGIKKRYKHFNLFLSGLIKNKKRFLRLNKFFLKYFKRVSFKFRRQRHFYLRKVRKLNNFIKVFNKIKNLEYRKHYKFQFRTRCLRTFSIFRNAPNLFSFRRKALGVRYKHYLRKYYKFYFRYFFDLKFAPKVYLLLRKSLFSLFKNRVNFRYFFSKKAIFFYSKKFRNKRKKWQKKKKAGYALFRGFQPNAYRYLQKPRNSAKRDFFYIKGYNPVYRKYKLRNPFFRRSLSKFMGKGRFRNLGYLSARKLYLVFNNNNLTLLNRLQLLLKQQIFPMSLFRTKLLLTFTERSKIQSSYSIKSINSPAHRRFFSTLFPFLVNGKVIRLGGDRIDFLFWLMLKISSNHSKLNKFYSKSKNFYKIYSILPRQLKFSLFSILSALRRNIIRKLYFYNYVLKSKKTIRLSRIYFLTHRHFLKNSYDIFQFVGISISRKNRLKKIINGYRKLVRGFDYFLKCYDFIRKRNNKNVVKKHKFVSNTTDHVSRKNKLRPVLNQDYAVFGGKKYFYKYKGGLPVVNRQNLIFLLKHRKRLTLEIYFKKILATFSRIPRSTNNYKFFYLPPWEYRAQKREAKEKSLKLSRDAFLEDLKKKFTKQQLHKRAILFKSRVFFFNFKNFLSISKNFFRDRLPRTVILNRDRIYYSKWGYVKFRATNNNLFISIYNRHHKLIHCTTAWASASRRDPNRFAYKSLVFAARKLAARLWKLRFKRINVRLNSPTNFQIRIFLKTLKIKKIKVLDVLNYIKLPHNGLRPQKSRTQS